MSSVESAQSAKRERNEENVSNCNATESKKVKCDQKNDIVSVMERINRFLTDDKKFIKACPLYEKLIEEKKSDSTLLEVDKEAIFGGIKSIVLCGEILFSSAHWLQLSQLFSVLESAPTLFTDEQSKWITTWKTVLTIIRSMESDDTFVVANIHKDIDRLIESWVKAKKSGMSNMEKTFFGNLQIYVIEILIRLLSLAVMEYRLTPVFKSIQFLVNEHESIFDENKPFYETLYSQYRDKKMKKTEKRVVRHFTEQDSRNRVHPMRLQGSNPYLL